MQSYSINELVAESGATRRHISALVSAGLLAGSSNRGRGAHYGESDLNRLKVIPRLRTLLRPEFGSLARLKLFLDILSESDVARLADCVDSSDFDLEARRLKIKALLIPVLPHLQPEAVDKVLLALSPEQIRAVDTGSMLVGAIPSVRALLISNQVNAAGALMEQAAPAQGGDADHYTPNGAEYSGEAVQEQIALSTGEILGQLENVISRLERMEKMLAGDV